MNKLSQKVSKTPLPIVLVILLMTVIIRGIVTTMMQTMEASLTQIFSISTFEKYLKITLIYIACVGIEKFANKIMHYNVISKVFLKKFEMFINSNLATIQKLNSGKMQDAVSNMASILPNIIGNCIYIIPIIIPFSSLIIKEWKIRKVSSILTIVVVIITFIMSLISNKLFKWDTNRSIANSKLKGVTTDNFINIKTIKTLGIGSYCLNRLKQHQNESIKYSVKISQNIYFRIVDIIRYSPLFLNIYLFRNNNEMIAYLLFSNYLVDQMVGYLNQIAEDLILYKEQYKIISELNGSEKGLIKPILKDKIHLKNVIFDYGEESTIKFFIEELVFNRGNRYLIYGESGEGKSSLANLLTGIIKPSNININIPMYDTYYVWQETEMLDDTLWNNIVFDNPDSIDQDEILELFKHLNMFDWFIELDDGFDTIIGERGCRLSSGQKQRINIIRCLLNMKYHTNKIFIIDEITSNLDDTTRELAIDLINKYCTSTLICISHNEGFDKICEHHILVEKHSFKQIK